MQPPLLANRDDRCRVWLAGGEITRENGVEQRLGNGTAVVGSWRKRIPHARIAMRRSCFLHASHEVVHSERCVAREYGALQSGCVKESQHVQQTGLELHLHKRAWSASITWQPKLMPPLQALPWDHSHTRTHTRERVH